MRVFWIMPVCVAAVGWLPIKHVAAQGLLAPTRTYGQPEQYQTPGYKPPTPSSLDKGFGLPTLGTDPLRQKATTLDKKPNEPAVPDFFPNGTQQTMAPPDQKTDGPDVPDFFADSKEITLPKALTSKAATAGMETPTFTTSEGSASDTMETSTGDTLARPATTDMWSSDTEMPDRAVKAPR